MGGRLIWNRLKISKGHDAAGIYFIVNLNRLHTWFWCFHCRPRICRCRLGSDIVLVSLFLILSKYATHFSQAFGRHYLPDTMYSSWVTLLYISRVLPLLFAFIREAVRGLLRLKFWKRFWWSFQHIVPSRCLLVPGQRWGMGYVSGLFFDCAGTFNCPVLRQ